MNAATLMKIGQFAGFCAVRGTGGQGPAEDAPMQGIVDPIVAEYERLFGHAPPNSIVIMVVLESCVVELPRESGRYVHTMTSSTPKFVLRLLEHLGVEVEAVVVQGASVPSWRM